MVKRSRDVADGMSNGIKFLMKKNKIDVLSGTGVIKTGKKVAIIGAGPAGLALVVPHVHAPQGLVNFLILNKTEKKLLAIERL